MSRMGQNLTDGNPRSLVNLRHEVSRFVLNSQINRTVTQALFVVEILWILWNFCRSMTLFIAHLPNTTNRFSLKCGTARVGRGNNLTVARESRTHGNQFYKIMKTKTRTNRVSALIVAVRSFSIPYVVYGDIMHNYWFTTAANAPHS